MVIPTYKRGYEKHSKTAKRGRGLAENNDKRTKDTHPGRECEKARMRLNIFYKIRSATVGRLSATVHEGQKQCVTISQVPMHSFCRQMQGLILSSHRSRGHCRCSARKIGPVTGYLRNAGHLGPCSRADSSRRTCAPPPLPGWAELALRRSVWGPYSPCAPSESGRYQNLETCAIGRSEHEDRTKEKGSMVPWVCEVCQRAIHPRRSDCHHDN